MKKMTCIELGGACDLEFRADSFEKMAELSKIHGMDMFKCKDPAHIEAMERMQDLMKTPGAMEAWYEKMRKHFEALPDIEEDKS